MKRPRNAHADEGVIDAVNLDVFGALGNHVVQHATGGVLHAVHGDRALVQTHVESAVAVGGRGDLIVKWRENTNFAAGGEDDVAVVVHAGERSLGEEDDLLGLQTEVVVIVIEWGEGSVKWTHRIYFSVSACVIGLVIT